MMKMAAAANVAATVAVIELGNEVTTHYLTFSLKTMLKKMRREFGAPVR
jgi:hypothetical protein